MASRALGAMLAFVAAIAFAASLASPKLTTLVPAWWDGHPTVDGKGRTVQDVHIGPFGAAGCNNRGCSAIPVSDDFELISFGELGGVVLALGFSILLGLSAWRTSNGRKTVALLAMLVALLAAGGAGFMLW